MYVVCDTAGLMYMLYMTLQGLCVCCMRHCRAYVYAVYDTAGLMYMLYMTL